MCCETKKSVSFSFFLCFYIFVFFVALFYKRFFLDFTQHTLYFFSFHVLCFPILLLLCIFLFFCILFFFKKKMLCLSKDIPHTLSRTDPYYFDFSRFFVCTCTYVYICVYLFCANNVHTHTRNVYISIFLVRSFFISLSLSQIISFSKMNKNILYIRLRSFPLRSKI